MALAANAAILWEEHVDTNEANDWKALGAIELMDIEDNLGDTTMDDDKAVLEANVNALVDHNIEY